MLVWAAHNGGYDADTWYWGALVLLALSAATLIALGARRRRVSRASIIALTAFVCYLLWSYLSMAWAQTPGWALEGSNRTLLYLLVFALFLVLPWTPEAALATLLLFVLGVGTIAIVMLLRLATGDHVQQLTFEGRLTSPTGYFNSSVALFMINALLATVLATRRELPGLLRGLLIGIACASLELCVLGESRGWLFTLPLVVVIAIVIVPDRLRVAVAAILPVAGTLAVVHRLLHVFQSQTGTGLNHAAERAGHASLTVAAGAMVLGTLIAWAETLARVPSFSRAARRRLGVVVTLVVLASASAGAVAATHGDPFGFVKRQWHGFSHPTTGDSSGSHFGTVGSGRYDFWRVSLDALAAHPFGGLGQDNFADYYVRRRRTAEEPRWTHSLEMRVLAHTGVVGFALFTAFLVAAVAAAFPALRRTDGLTRAVSGAALLPLTVWLIHGSVDWFWEMPALTAPALGFLGMAGAFGNAVARSNAEAGSNAVARSNAEVGSNAETRSTPPARSRLRIPRAVGFAAGGLAFVAATLVLAFPYLSVRELSFAASARQRNPSAALDHLATAADLDPLSPDPTRLAGTIALQTDQFVIAQKRFRQTISREPGGWFGWLGAGLAASALGDANQAFRDFKTAASINSQEPAIKEALARVNTEQPLTATEAFQLLTTG